MILSAAREMRRNRSPYVLGLISAMGGKPIPYMGNGEGRIQNFQVRTFSVDMYCPRKALPRKIYP
jgi:hypothetical protein